MEQSLLNLSQRIVCFISFESIFCAYFKNIKFTAIWWSYWHLWWFIIFVVKMAVLLKKTKNMVIWRIMSHQIKYLWHCESFGPKILYITVKIEIFENFTNDVILTGSEQTPRIHVSSCSVVDYWVISAENKIVTVSLNSSLGAKINFLCSNFPNFDF